MSFPILSFFVVFSIFVLLNLLDTITNGEVLGRILATHIKCPESADKIEHLWQATMGESLLLKILPIVGHKAHFYTIALIAYLFQLANPLYALFFSVPFDWKKGCCQDQNVDFKIARGELFQEYKTLWNFNKINHGQVIMVQSSLARMDMINFQDTSYRIKLMELLDEQFPDPGRERGGKRFTQEEKKDHLTVMLGLLERATSRFFCIGLLQNALQTNLQISLAGINWAVSGSPDDQLLFSIVMCWFATIADWPDMAETIKIMCTQYKKVKKDDVDDGPDIKKLRRTIIIKLGFFVLLFIVYFWISSWSATKFWALFGCDHSHLWDFKFTFDLKEGCVTFIQTNSSLNASHH